MNTLNAEHHSHFDKDDQEIDSYMPGHDNEDNLSGSEFIDALTHVRSPGSSLGRAKCQTSVSQNRMTICDDGLEKSGKQSSFDSARARYSGFVLSELEARYAKSPFIYKPEKTELACRLNITEKQLQKWFINRRGRDRKYSPPIVKPAIYQVARKRTIKPPEQPPARRFKQYRSVAFNRALIPFKREIKGECSSTGDQSSVSKLGVSLRCHGNRSSPAKMKAQDSTSLIDRIKLRRQTQYLTRARSLCFPSHKR